MAFIKWVRFSSTVSSSFICLHVYVRLKSLVCLVSPDSACSCPCLCLFLSHRLHPHCPGLALYIASPAHGSFPLAKLKQQQQQQATVSRLVLYPDRPRSLLRSCWCPRSAESYSRTFKPFVKPGTELGQALRHQVPQFIHDESIAILWFTYKSLPVLSFDLN